MPAGADGLQRQELNNARLNRQSLTANIMSGIFMNRIVDPVMLSAANIGVLAGRPTKKVSKYVELLCSTGKRDPDELAALGVA